jgi:hypothetical protein
VVGSILRYVVRDLDRLELRAVPLAACSRHTAASHKSRKDLESVSCTKPLLMPARRHRAGCIMSTENIIEGFTVRVLRGTSLDPTERPRHHLGGRLMCIYHIEQVT